MSDKKRGGGISRAAFIQQCYYKYLGRLADAEGLAAFHQSGMSEQDIEKVFVEGPERKALLRARDRVRDQLERYSGQKILIVGAFGNGNLGDAIQAKLIAESLGIYPNMTFFSYSDLKTADYDFSNGQKLDDDYPGFSLGPLNSEILSLFDAMIIGGGGLLAYPHYPMWNEHWPYFVTIPYVLWACGVAEPAPSPTVNLIKRAQAVSGRDSYSRHALLTVRSDALYCPDPVLALLKHAPRREGQGRAYILRGPIRDIHHKILSQMKVDDIVVSLEVATDWPLFHLFPQLQIVSSMSKLFEVIANKKEVVSERYHGVIAALHLGKVTYGLTTNDHNEAKIQSLLGAIGAPEFCGRDCVASRDNFPFDKVEQFLNLQMKNYTEAAHALIKSALRDVPSIDSI